VKQAAPEGQDPEVMGKPPRDDEDKNLSKAGVNLQQKLASLQDSNRRLI
jgi:hypothetical protein